MSVDNPVLNRENPMRQVRRARIANNAGPYPAPINPLPAFPPNFAQNRPPLRPRNRQVPLFNRPLLHPPGQEEPIIIGREQIIPSRTQADRMYQINFPVGTRVGVIEFISPNGVSEWLDSAGFSVVIGNLLPRQDGLRRNNLVNQHNQHNQFREQVIDMRPFEHVGHEPPQPDEQNARQVEEGIQRNRMVPNDAVPLDPVVPEPPLLNGPVNQVGGDRENILPPARALNGLNNVEPLVPAGPVDQQYEIEPARAVADNQVIDNFANNLPPQPILNPLANVSVLRPIKEVSLPVAKIKNSASIPIPKIGGSKNKIEIKNGFKSNIKASSKQKPTVSITDRPKKKKKQQVENVLSANVSPTQMQQAEYDLYCWICHMPHFYKETNELSNRRCECGLICHETCRSILFPREAPRVAGISPATGQYKTFDLSYMVGKCKECMFIEAGAVYNREFGFETVDSSILFSYASARLTENLTYICFRKFNANPHVVRPMDLKTIATKSENGIYRSTEEFIFDLKLAIHNSYIIKVTTKDEYDYATMGKNLLRTAREELAYLNMCPGCYRNYYEIKESVTIDMGLDFPCEYPHGLVWAKKDIYWFPAKVYEYRTEDTFVASQELVSIIFFGTGKSGSILVNPNQLYMYSKNFPTPQPQYRGKVKSNFMKAQSLISQYVKYLDNFFVHNYQVPDNATSFDWEEIFITVSEPKDRVDALKNIAK